MSNEKASYEVKEDTGEVIENNSYTPGQGRVAFRTMWSNPYGITAQDLSREIEDVYTEITPYAVDPDTGNFLNDSSVPKIVKTGTINVQERIQSFSKEVDLYSILEKFAYSDDPALVNARPCAYGDLSELPNDLNGFSMFVNAQFNKLNDMNPELAKMVVDENVTADQIQAKAREILDARIASNKPKESEENK